MTRKEYMEQLKKYLKRLPKEDYDNAIEYFSEYFDEAGPENEQQVMEELGQPKEAARELLLNLLQESVGDSKDITEKKTAALPAAGSYYGESSHAHSRTDSGNLSTTGYSTSAGKKRSPRKDHSSRISGDLCIAGEHCAAVCRPCSTGSSGDCHRSSDLFHGSYRCISNCRRYRAHRFRRDIDRKISGSSLHDGRQWISDGRCGNPRWSTYHIYM